MSDQHPTIIRTRKNRENPYTMIARQPLNDTQLSWEARGVLAYLLDKPDDWEVRFQDLVSKGPGAEDRMRRILKELAGAGYVRRTRLKGDHGRFVWATVVYETPALADSAASSAGEIPPPPLPPSRQNRHMAPPAPSAGFPSMDEPSMEKPSMENRHIYRIRTEPNTEVPNTEGERDAPAPPDVMQFTIDDPLLSWWRGQCMGAGLGLDAVNVDEETARWQDAIASGSRAHPAHAVADWRQWMRRALSWAQAHPEKHPHVRTGTDQRPLEPDLGERAARAAEQLRAALGGPLPGPGPARG